MRDTTHMGKKSQEQIVEAIFALDLENVKQQLRDKEEGEGWSVDQANYYEMEYKQFLALSVKYPEADLSPSKNVDAFWHAHILNTRQYARDCESTFGYFMHHEPGTRDGSAAEKSRYEKGFQLFGELKQREFSSIEMSSAAYCARAPQVQSESAAYCALSTTGTIDQAAYCALQLPRNMEKAAYCALQLPCNSEQAKADLL